MVCMVEVNGLPVLVVTTHTITTRSVRQVQRRRLSSPFWGRLNYLLWYKYLLFVANTANFFVTAMMAAVVIFSRGEATELELPRSKELKTCLVYKWYNLTW